jgi:hypothetical protein
MEFTRECYKLWLARWLLLLSSDPGQVEKTFIRENIFISSFRLFGEEEKIRSGKFPMNFDRKKFKKKKKKKRKKINSIRIVGSLL